MTQSRRQRTSLLVLCCLTVAFAGYQIGDWSREFVVTELEPPFIWIQFTRPVTAVNQAWEEHQEELAQRAYDAAHPSPPDPLPHVDRWTPPSSALDPGNHEQWHHSFPGWKEGPGQTRAWWYS